MIPDCWQANVDTASLTSMRCGGRASYLATPTSPEALRETLAHALRLGLPIKLLGGGSNLIFPDAGFAGVLIRPQFRWLRPVDEQAWEGQLRQLAEHATADQRYRAAGTGYLRLEDESESASGPLKLIEAGCDVAWGQLVQFSLQRRLHGLHRYARIPCKVGGAVRNNIHAGEHLLQEAVCAVQAMRLETGETRWYGQEELEFGYDTSRFHLSGEAILSVVFALPEVNEERSKADADLYRDWTAQKAAVQPSGPNAGSVFKNLTATQADAPVAAGYYVEACGFKGRQVGGMQVYPGHANFIINTGSGTQADFLALTEEIRGAVQDRFGILLEPEVECVQ